MAVVPLIGAFWPVVGGSSMPSKSAAITLPVVLMPRIQLASTVEPSACAAPCVRSGTRLATPPVPVVLATPVPVRMNQVSIVNCWRPSLVGTPIVTYAPLLPSRSAVCAAADTGEGAIVATVPSEVAAKTNVSRADTSRAIRGRRRMTRIDGHLDVDGRPYGRMRSLPSDKSCY